MLFVLLTLIFVQSCRSVKRRVAGRKLETHFTMSTEILRPISSLIMYTGYKLAELCNSNSPLFDYDTPFNGREISLS
ncbi:CLUMA_CG015016, isoform A [Clunio marinus]|uniref:CLUMA_CG015016, isoform A n=1 Tax=Clunio marinus TaxID=568069 RepID=A0A1J1INR3_9DIPT|nr:CLUMA_CG015016, isoform A [Clunio marinus]